MMMMMVVEMEYRLMSLFMKPLHMLERKQEKKKQKKKEKEEELEATHHEDAECGRDIEEDPGMISPREYLGMLMMLISNPKHTFVEDVLKKACILAESSHSSTPLHEHFEQAIRCILEGMDRESRGNKELYEHFESKIFIDNEKEKLTWVKLIEIKTYLENFYEELQRPCHHSKEDHA
ncbi:hypothetical protein Dimus_029354 [Dionaea muscipula]